MASGTTPVRKRPIPLESDTPDAAADISALGDSLDEAPNVGVGVLGSRPASLYPGDRWLVHADPTPANNGIEWVDTGSGWVAINPVDAAVGVPSLRTLGIGGQQAAAGNDSRIVGAEQVAEKGVPSGYCDLDTNGHVPLARLAGATAGGRIASDIPGSAGMQNATGLSIPVGANEVWAFSVFCVFYNSASGATYVPSLQLTGPPSPVSVLVFGRLDGSSSGNVSVVQALSTPVGAPGIQAINPGSWGSVSLRGSVSNGTTAGILQVQLSSNSALILKTGSWLVAWKVT